MADNSSNSGSSNSSTSGNNPIEQSPFGRLEEVVGKEGVKNLFSGVGKGEDGSSPFGGSDGSGGSQPDLAYGGNPFAGDNFWNIFAGGVNPSKVAGSPSTGGGSPSTGGGNQSSGSDPLTGAGGSSNSSAGGGNPSTGGSNQGSGSDPLTGTGSQTYGISTSEIPNGFDLRVTIDKLVASKLDKELGDGKTPSFGGSGGIPSFGGASGGGIPSFGGAS
ncbi:MAG: hypothetical protein RM368_23690, partial [Nostoc sp. DedSLP03]|nr:hypothetical protein [Nostoc sp. DedSLP03]